ncbi:hypothetical protein V1512DRAFT_234214 [Lipomyces arxii]|uniref:uncharacterized protein n=1 Tax=Lipomyces arxii TaxID=56418 RepID=UPI0034CD2F06
MSEQTSDQMTTQYSTQIKMFSALHPRPKDRTFTYGTAGFRLLGSLLDSVVFRVGLLAGLRSRKLKSQTIGVMITASHNPPADNGVKLVDPQGEMLEASWEVYATKFANAVAEDELVSEYFAVAKALQIDLATPANVIFARDTRESGPALVAALKDGLSSSGVEYKDYGILTTPQLHYIVKCINTANSSTPYGTPSEIGYYEKLSAAFKTILAGKGKPPVVTVDAANGVGGPKLDELAKYIGAEVLDVTVVNDDTATVEKLNHQCGADFVKTQQQQPLGLEPKPWALHASLDGDADRIVFYYVDELNKFFLLDGDKIASLAAVFIRDLIKVSALDLEVGVVQTAYANGSSSAYLKDTVKVPVKVTSTGVKHLHHAAQLFDIGVYFEANGHGTVLFSPSAIKTLETAEAQSPAQKDAITTLLSLADLINQTVGDALSDLLMVITILTYMRWGPQEWNRAYTDFPNRLVRVVVPDRYVFKTTNAERVLVEPVGLQAEIDALVKKYNCGRSFVRPSGTEDAIRVYSEAASRLEADELAKKVADLVQAWPL